MEELKSFLEEYECRIMAEADVLRAARMPALTEELFALFETNGNRLLYEHAYFERRKFLAVFGLAAVLKGRKEDFKKLEEVIEEICGESCWELPAHVKRRENPQNWQVTVALFSCETGFALAEIGSLCKDRLSDKIRRRIREEVERRILHPVEQSRVPCGNWENADHNWNAVCSAGIGGAALYLLQDEPARQEVLVRRMCASLRYYVDGFAKDGACMEGLGYFTYGMSFYCMFADLLEKFSYTKEARTLLSGQKIKCMMEFQQKCYFPGGLSVSFSDGSSHEHFRVGLTCFLAMHDEQVVFPKWTLAADLYTDSCWRWAILYRDILFADRYLKRNRTKKEWTESKTGGPRIQETLPDAQWTICRQSGMVQRGPEAKTAAAQSGARAAAAVKGGHNKEPHNHNDVGSFHYVVGEEVFLADLGAGEYTREYFQEETRYKIFVNQTQSHNLPLIDRCGQRHGREFACESFCTDGCGVTEMELAAAYGDRRLKSFRRSLSFDGTDGSLKVCDTFWAADKLCITENLVTPCEVKKTADGLLLQGKRQSCVLHLPEAAKVRINRVNYQNHAGISETVFQIQWEMLLNEGETKTAAFKITGGGYGTD